MNREQLINTAAQLQSLTPVCLSEFSLKRDRMIASVNEIMIARADIISLVGEGNLDMMKGNHTNHARFMESLFKEFNAEVLVDTVLWVFRAYRSRKFSVNYWTIQLKTWLEVYKKELTEESFLAIYPFYSWMIRNISHFNNLSQDHDVRISISH